MPVFARGRQCDGLWLGFVFRLARATVLEGSSYGFEDAAYPVLQVFMV